MNFLVVLVWSKDFQGWVKSNLSFIYILTMIIWIKRLWLINFMKAQVHIFMIVLYFIISFSITIVFCCIVAWNQPDVSARQQDKILLLSQNEISWEHFRVYLRTILQICRGCIEIRLKYEKNILLSSSRAFSMLSPMETVLFVSSKAFSLFTPVDSSEATWKKGTKCNKAN